MSFFHQKCDSVLQTDMPVFTLYIIFLQKYIKILPNILDILFLWFTVLFYEKNVGYCIVKAII